MPFPSKTKPEPVVPVEVEPEEQEISFPKSSEQAVFKSWRKVKIFEVPGETNSFPMTLGEYPTVIAIRGKEIILPTVLVKGILDHSVVSTFKHVELMTPDNSGNVFQTMESTNVRFPYQDLGPATEKEWLNSIVK